MADTVCRHLKVAAQGGRSEIHFESVEQDHLHYQVVDPVRIEYRGG